MSDRQKRLGQVYMSKVTQELCDVHDLQYPSEVRSFPLEDLIKTACHIFGKGEIELSDVIQDWDEGASRGLFHHTYAVGAEWEKVLGQGAGALSRTHAFLHRRLSRCDRCERSR